MLRLVSLTILLFCGIESKAFDDNLVLDPCVNIGALKKKDGISIGVAVAGELSSWYNNSNTNLNILSPCSKHLAAQLPQSAVVTVFRPVIEQIGQLELENTSYVQLRNAFPGNATVIVYGGGNPTVISTPRYFLYADGRVPELTLDIHFEGGKLTHFL